MPYTVTRQTVGDFPRWRRAFDDNSDAREEAGSRGGHIFRDDEDHGRVVIFLAWEDLDEAREYLASDHVEEEREEGEVEDRETLFLEELGRPNH
jgi:heme-degrading monooxygenase HmoA